jgi:MFS family permease
MDSERRFSASSSLRNGERQPLDDENLHEEEAMQPPTRGRFLVLLIGAAVGFLCVIINVVLTFVNAPIYEAVAHEGSAVTANTYTVFGLACLNFLIQVLACFLAGFVVGKWLALRKPGFFAGAVTAFVVYVSSFLANYIPGYPGRLTPSTPTSSTAITNGTITVIVFLIVWMAIGGLMSLWGAYVATRRHPYYNRVAEEE